NCYIFCLYHIDELNGTFKVENVSEACPNSWPWHVSLQSHDTHYCSGVLIHPRWVLAPRHCLVILDFMLMLHLKIWK
uniref:Peptidase S1 domain-containing protein n=1 Tax=Sinocyclocheilus rhinocerous TaxID=307959 RepID=A0A673FSD2_9TELE